MVVDGGSVDDPPKMGFRKVDSNIFPVTNPDFVFLFF